MKVKLTAAAILCCVLLTGCQIRLSTGIETTTRGDEAAPSVTSISPSSTASDPTNRPHTTTASVTTDQPMTESPETQGFDPNPSAPDASKVHGLVPESPAADPSWFDDAAFIGDSVSVMLKTYCLTGALGKAQFFAVGSYSTVNALRPVSDGGPHPAYRGETMTCEDCIQKSGAKKVFIMLGMNDLSYGIDSTITRYQTLVDQILEKSPDVEIFVQSMTPMTSTSTLMGNALNNANIKLYNQRLLQLCEENGWYFVDVASVMYDDNGENLRAEYCCDPEDMGVHFAPQGCARWVDYLLTHTVHLT